MAFLQALEGSKKLIEVECKADDALYALLLEESRTADGKVTSLNEKINALYENQELLESLDKKSGILRLSIQNVLAQENALSYSEKNKLAPIFNILYALLVALTKAYPTNNRVPETEPLVYECFISLCPLEIPVFTSEGVILDLNSFEDMVTKNGFGYTNPVTNLAFGPRDIAYIKQQANVNNVVPPSDIPNLQRYDNMVQILVGFSIYFPMFFTALFLPPVAAALIVLASFVFTIAGMAAIAFLKPVTRIANFFNLRSQSVDNKKNNYIDKLLEFVPQHEPVEEAKKENGRSEAGLSASESPAVAPVPRAVNDSTQAPPARLQLINSLYGSGKEVVVVDMLQPPASPRI